MNRIVNQYELLRIFHSYQLRAPKNCGSGCCSTPSSPLNVALVAVVNLTRRWQCAATWRRRQLGRSYAALRHTVRAHGAVSRYEKFSTGSRFCTRVRPPKYPLKFSPGCRPLGMGDSGNGGSWGWWTQTRHKTSLQIICWAAAATFTLASPRCANISSFIYYVQNTS